MRKTLQQPLLDQQEMRRVAGVEVALQAAHGLGPCTCAELCFMGPDGRPMAWVEKTHRPVLARPCPAHPDVPRRVITFPELPSFEDPAPVNPASESRSSDVRAPLSALPVGDSNPPPVSDSIPLPESNSSQLAACPIAEQGGPAFPAEDSIPPSGLPGATDSLSPPTDSLLDSPISPIAANVLAPLPRPQAAEAAPVESPSAAVALEPSAAPLKAGWYSTPSGPKKSIDLADLAQPKDSVTVEICPGCGHLSGDHGGGHFRGRCMANNLTCPCDGYRPPESMTPAPASLMQERPSERWNPND
jgi:hypothetical protein